MHGLGNDFVVIDARRAPLALDAGAGARASPTGATGIGCDQLIAARAAAASGGAGVMRILQCRRRRGRSLRQCHALRRRLLMRRDRRPRGCASRPVAGLLEADARRTAASASIWAAAHSTGARFRWRASMDTVATSIWRSGRCADPVCTNIGNPHATFFVADAEAIDLAALGPLLEHHPLFPERANVGFAQVHRPRADPPAGLGARRRHHPGLRHRRLRRAGRRARRGLTGRSAAVWLDGGELDIEWRDDGHVLMTGPAALELRGRARRRS